MIIRKLNDIIGTERDVTAEDGNWVSRRLLLRKDGMGFSLHETTIFAGTETYMHYKNHLEAVYCIGGEGEIEDLDSGETHEIFNGVMYALNAHDRHCLRTRSDMRLICVFTPALVGSERHDSDGGYPLIEVESHKATTPLPAGKG